MSTSWDADRCSVHVLSDDQMLRDLVTQAVRAGARRTDLDIAVATDRDELLQQFQSRFEIPYPMGGFDGALDWLSDLDWLPESNGHVVVVHGLDRADSKTRSIFVAMLPFVLDRWREGSSLPYVYLLRARSRRAEVLAALSRSNAELADVGRRDTVTHTAPVPVIVDGELVDPKLTDD